jgi:ribosome biogenesis GTPase A
MYLGANKQPKKPRKRKRLNVLVFGESKVGKSALIEHMLLTLNAEQARSIFAMRVNDV